MSHVQVKLDGDTASAHSVVIASMHRGEEGIGRIRVRAIDYQDELAKIDGEWKITKRVHRPTLQGRVPGRGVRAVDKSPAVATVESLA